MPTGMRRSGWAWGTVGEAAIGAARAAASAVAPAPHCGGRPGGADALPGGMR
jgi:hypothetical protein